MINILYNDLSNIMHPEYLKISIKAKNKQRREYKHKKAHARRIAQNWQQITADSEHSWQWCINWAARFERIGKKYGLLKEFKQNGIL